MIVGSLGTIGYYSELLKGHVHDYVAVGIFLLPVANILFIQKGEVPNKIVSITHRISAIYFMILSIGMEVGTALGYKPEGTVLCKLLAHISWTFAWTIIYKESKKIETK